MKWPRPPSEDTRRPALFQLRAEMSPFAEGFEPCQRTGKVLPFCNSSSNAPSRRKEDSRVREPLASNLVVGVRIRGEALPENDNLWGPPGVSVIPETVLRRSSRDLRVRGIAVENPGVKLVA